MSTSTSREEGPAARAHRSDAAAAGGRRRAGRADSRAGRPRARRSSSTSATRSCSTSRSLTASEFNTAQSNYTVAQRERQVGAGHARSREAEPELHEIYAPIDGVVVERERRRRPDGRRQPLGAAAVPDRERPVAHADPRVASTRATSARSTRASTVTFTVQAYPNQTLHGDGASGAPAVGHDGERRELHGGRLGREPKRQAAARHDGDAWSS